MVLIDLTQDETILRDALKGWLQALANHAQPVRQVALYACPWSGWVALCLGSQVQDSLSCADMDQPEAELLEMPHWSKAYEDHDRFTIIGHDGTRWEYDVETTGDEGFNEPVWRMLVHVLQHPEIRARARALGATCLGAQTLDSSFARLFTV